MSVSRFDTSTNLSSRYYTCIAFGAVLDLFREYYGGGYTPSKKKKVANVTDEADREKNGKKMRRWSYKTFFSSPFFLPMMTEMMKCVCQKRRWERKEKKLF